MGMRWRNYWVIMWKEVGFILIVVSTLLAGIAVSVSGLIGFVGLVVPHMLRLLVGNDYNIFTAIIMLRRWVLLVFADANARSWFDPNRIACWDFIVLLRRSILLIFNSERRKTT